MTDRPHRSRAISPVVGVVLLVAVVLGLSVIAAGLVFSLAQEEDPVPSATLSLERDQGAIGEHQLVHQQGETIDGDRLRIRGVADPDALAGTELRGGTRHALWPVDEDISVVWFGDDETSYVLREFTVDSAALLPAPDEGCGWVDSESNSGTSDVKVDDLVVDCDVETDKVVEVLNGGVVIGDTESDAKNLDADGAEFYGDVAVETDVNLQRGRVTGSVTARTEGVKIDDATVGGPIRAEKLVEVLAGSSVGGDVVSDSDGVKVLDSTVSGAIAADGVVKLQGATVTGDVYVDDADFDCTDSSIAGQDCDAYTPQDPEDY